MDAPRCKLCGERHWGLCATTPEQSHAIARQIIEHPPPIGKKPKLTKRAPMVTQDKPVSLRGRIRKAPTVHVEEKPSSPVTERVKTWQRENPEKHAANQRAWRAKKRMERMT